MDQKNPKSKLICLCNSVPQSEIEEAIMSGCDTTSKISGRTAAGVGECGGSCQPTLRLMLETYKQTGKFPENPRAPSRGTRK